jgi:hypothetical protein
MMISMVLMSHWTKVSSWVVWCLQNMFDLDGAVYICTPVEVLGHGQRSSIVVHIIASQMQQDPIGRHLDTYSSTPYS